MKVSRRFPRKNIQHEVKKLTFLPKDADVPLCRHAEYGAHHAAGGGNEGSRTQRQVLGLVVIIRVVMIPSAAAEEEVLLGDDGDEEGGPVGEDGEEVGEDLGEVLAPGDARDGVDHEREERPEEAGHERERPPERLDGEPRAVRVRDVVRTVGRR